MSYSEMPVAIPELEEFTKNAFIHNMQGLQITLMDKDKQIADLRKMGTLLEGMLEKVQGEAAELKTTLYNERTAYDALKATFEKEQVAKAELTKTTDELKDKVIKLEAELLKTKVALETKEKAEVEAKQKAALKAELEAEQKAEQEAIRQAKLESKRLAELKAKEENDNLKKELLLSGKVVEDLTLDEEFLLSDQGQAWLKTIEDYGQEPKDCCTYSFSCKFFTGEWEGECTKIHLPYEECKYGMRCTKLRSSGQCTHKHSHSDGKYLEVKYVKGM